MTTVDWAVASLSAVVVTTALFLTMVYVMMDDG